MSKVFVSMPSYGGIHQKTVLNIPTISYNHEINLKCIENCALIVKARQGHFSMFLKSGMDYLLTFDADMVVGPPGIVDRMIDICPPNSIIGGLYAMKAHTPDMRTIVNGMSIDEQPITKLDGSLIEMKYLPTGFMMTPRSVAEKIVEAYPDLAYTDETIGKAWAVYNCILKKDAKGITRFLPEDFSYCERARACGVKIYADTACQIGHIGNFLYHLEHLRT